ncbi:ATP-dependent helicase HrpB [Brevundimonas sp. 2R-24]|uniref:ATP-dependent helicase HrpB n=1 Tax=Peiella sedimenti TaxID=3061083 RepID=A0ABT8SLM3_9CAUL|nr:ATP-dependent helicase HrpB [Caulobacteraceae bacterium XZ-24]
MLPIDAVLEELKSALREHTRAVLVAPPGAGKTTGVPPALLDQPWAPGGRIVVLEPRRLAAKGAAARMAAVAAESLGATFGYRVRMESRVSAQTRVEVVTEGVFTRLLMDDPSLEGVAAVLFDEFHERSLEADLGLALALECQAVMRPDLRLLVMSATLDGARVARLLDGAPVIQSEGRAYPVDTRYLGRDPRERLEEGVARAVMRALAEEDGSVLAFLPGQGEIERVRERLEERLRDRPIDIAPLYGALDVADQDAAIRPAGPDRRKVVLATAIAETSLTIEGVRVVIDGGFTRAPRYDPASGLTRLETIRVSRAEADQRRGRAGRTASGVCYRLWDEEETRGLKPFATPEILAADLSGFALTLAQWGLKDASGLALLNPPPAGPFAEARALLARLGALDGLGVLTPHGRAMAAMAAPPRLAHMMLEGTRLGSGRTAAELAVLLTERGLGGRDPDLDERLRMFRRDRGPRARRAMQMAARWMRQLGDDGDGAAGPLVALAYPERVAKARGGVGEFLTVAGRGLRLEPTETLARTEWLAVAELGSGASSDRILSAAALTAEQVFQVLGDQIEEQVRLDQRPDGRLAGRRIRRLGRIVLSEEPMAAVPPDAVMSALLEQVRERGLEALPWGERGAALRARLAFLRAHEPDAGWPDVSDEALLADLDVWLRPLLSGRRALSEIGSGALAQALKDRVDWSLQRRLDQAGPEAFEAPTGTRAPIDYAAEGGPRIEIRVQELFGLTRHPTVLEGRVPLTISLLSPARRPIQVTRDLPGFWRGSWASVRSEMRGRYPKHPWPEDPAAAPPTTRAKPRGT